MSITKTNTVTKTEKKEVLQGLPEIRRFFYRNEKPIYFISATNFNLLGADEWVRKFKFICYIECFDGDHPNVFSPQEELAHEEFTSIEDINNYLLEHKEVVDYIKSRGDGGKALFLMFDERTEELAKKNNLEVCFPSAKMRNFMDNKVNTNRIAEKAGVPCVPYVLTKISSYADLGKKAEALGTDLVIQLPFGDSGHTTFFINDEGSYKKYADEIEKEVEVKVMKRINCRGSAIEACVTQHGTIVAPLMTELVGFKELTPYKGGWCGNEIYADAFTKAIRDKARKYTQLFGDQLKKEGYKGYFELDFLIDQDNDEIYLGELNPRITGASSITNHAVFALADMPLFMFHLLEWMDQPYKIDVNAINARWAKKENIDDWCQLVIKYTEDNIKLVTDAPKSGIWRLTADGGFIYDRMDTHRRAIEDENEAFFLRITRKGDYLYEGADMGILVLRGRLMTDDFELKDRAKVWIDAMKGKYASIDPSAAQLEVVEAEIAETAGFKMM
ncbi:biotin carboxylase [Pedobacter endophyticus]|uniref:Biotin carboxylase n=1 Tax=Pedobacter endophyticus TaxID=2789740 RepID=A0A7S9PZI4_9SPHI|nr:biotin carboxylase [Pedobacter endophyticus]QPH39697.1 biotin carboxylase [Pedobacter endophyticus]